jgi:hypothetical protein
MKEIPGEDVAVGKEEQLEGNGTVVQLRGQRRVRLTAQVPHHGIALEVEAVGPVKGDRGELPKYTRPCLPLK